jgi:hypothetical protein
MTLQQLDVVRHVVAVRLEADAARLDPVGCEIEADLAQPGGGIRRVRRGQGKVIDIAC